MTFCTDWYWRPKEGEDFPARPGSAYIDGLGRDAVLAKLGESSGGRRPAFYVRFSRSDRDCWMQGTSFAGLGRDRVNCLSFLTATDSG